ncbi:hypothetical protein DFP72DRAFT_755938, partial [Ephemerocybe angulata]
KVFKELPPEAQQTLLEKSLSDVLDQLPPDVAKKVYSSALKVQTKHQDVPKLDLRGKRKQVNAMVDLFTRESKMSMFGERTRREEVVSEIMETLTGWLGDVWSAFYEHRVQYSTAHHCLLYVAEVLNQLEAAPSPAGCKCELMNMPVRVTIKDKTGACMTKLRVRGPQNVDRILLWIWRDLLVCTLARNLNDDRKRVVDILQDLEGTYGFPVLERLLRGGRKTEHEEDEDEEDIFLEDETYSDREDSDEDGGILSYMFRRTDFTGSHWKGKFKKESDTLRTIVEDFLFDIFSIAPGLDLYDSIIEVSLNPTQSSLRASGILSEVAGNSSDTLAGALQVEASKNSASRIVSLLDQHAHLLRPRDTILLQCAAGVLGQSPFHARGLALLEAGLQETLVTIQMAVRHAFVHIEEPEHRRELQEIVKLRVGSQARRDRIEAWAQAIMASSSNGMNHMALAAMMFGIPMMPGLPGLPPMPGMLDDVGDEQDLMGFMDFEGGADADMEELREEFRPKLKQRFEGWTELATVMKGGGPLAAKAYVKAIEIMPFFRATDVVNEMVNRLSDRPGKGFVCDALESVSAFCKTQRKRINTARKEKERQAAKASKSA